MSANSDLSQVLEANNMLPSIPFPSEDLKSLHEVVLALKEGYEILARQRGNVLDSACSVQDLEKILGRGI